MWLFAGAKVLDPVIQQVERVKQGFATGFEGRLGMDSYEHLLGHLDGKGPDNRHLEPFRL